MRSRTIKISHSYPLPGHGKPRNHYPFGEMKPGDSFLVRCAPKAMTTMQSSVLSAARSFAKTKGQPMEFTTRRVTNGVRLWRVK